MKVLGKQVYRFEGVEVDPSQGCLRRNGEELGVRQKSFQVLVYLLEQRHRLVTKEELIERVWKGQAVTDDALVQLIKELRRSLGDDPRNPRFIKTVPRGGYRFIAPVEEFHFDLPVAVEVERRTSVEIEYEEEITETRGYGDAATRRDSNTNLSAPRASARLRVVMAAAVAAVMLVGALAVYLMTRPRLSTEQLAEVTLPPLPGKRPVAVMYFDNQSASSDLEWLREGLADMLITELSRSKRLTVLGRQQLHLLLERMGQSHTDAARLDNALEIGRKSQAEVIVLGSFARLGEKIRVNVNIYDARTGHLHASESIVADKPDDILTQVGLLSLKLATHLGVSPDEQEGRTALASVMTENLEAYRYYSLGVEKAQTLLYVEAVALLEKAASLDPEFAMAYARIGYTYALCWNRPDEGKRYLEKAFQLSSRLTEKDKLSIIAWYAVANLDYPAAIETYSQIISRYPLEVEAYWRLARLLRGEERMEESVDIARQGLVIDSGAKDLYNVLGITYTEVGRHDEAIATLDRYIELAPEDPNVYDSLGMSYQWAGRYPEAIETFEKALSLNPQFEIAVIHLGNTYVWQGRYRDAMRQYQRYIQVASFDANRARGYDSIAMLHLKRKEFAEAERAARAAIKYEKQNVGSPLLLALERGDLATAEKLMTIVEVGRSHDRGNRGYERLRSYYRGYLALKSGRAAEAVEHFKATIRHRPLEWYIDAHEDCLANAYLELGHLDEAIAEYERILRLNPHYPLVHYYLAQAYDRKGEREQARSHYERFLQIWSQADPDVPEVIAARHYLASHP